MRITIQLFMWQIQGCGCAYAFTASSITYKSCTVVNNNSEPFQQTAMREVVLAMLYEAHLYKKISMAPNNYNVHINQDLVFGQWLVFISAIQLIILNSSLHSTLR